jgi:hypothetical protein
MRGFVLTTGRSGSTTFARACGHLANFTAGHETRWPSAPDFDPVRRLDYPDYHIEVDNRLAWFLGPLHLRYPGAFYVHLTRDPADVARSFENRWQGDSAPSLVRKLQQRLSPSNPRVSAMTMFAYPMLGRSEPWTVDARPQIARMLVDTVNTNIEHFLTDKPHTRFDLFEADNEFPKFCARIGAKGDIDSAVREFRVRHNAS